ncbi:MAG TPA: site-2 protease family protein [Streptosporangiaceae bacterium]|jgi:membrane-associated protease RseP (regulator of RpoE activity)|nr:site-2 protease family protein [Streptosporangiaceae bacterium]
MSVLLGWVIFIVALSISVMLHEFGHFATAKKFGMKATQFFLGFGPTLWSRKRGETEYGVKGIPAGGFVKIVGMTSMDDVDPADEPRSFRVKPGWQRVIVLVAGSFMHFALAFFLLLIVPMAVGIANANTTTVGTVVKCVPKTDESGCASGEAPSPAAQIGLQPGDTIVAFAGQPVHTWNQFTTAIRHQKPGSRVAVTIQHDGRQVSKDVTLAKTRSIGSNGKAGQDIAFVGVAQAEIYQRASPLRAVSYAGSMFGQAVTGTVDVIRSLPSAVSHLFAKNRASTSGGQVTSVIGVGEITGQVVSAKIGWQPKASLVLLIIISVNIFIGLMNLLPLLPLDGGHVAVVLYERLRAWLARLRGRPDPGLVDMTKLIPVSLGVFALLIGFSLLLIMADIVNPINILQ